MKILKNKLFSRWANEINLEDSVLKNAIEEIKNGLFGAD
jgi:hypothetical protein